MLMCCKFFIMALQFSSFDELKNFIKNKESREFVQLSITDSRTLGSARKRVKRPLRNELEYYQIQYKCIHSGLPKSRSKGLRPNQSTYKQECPFVMNFRASADGNTLDLISSIDQHNHDQNKAIKNDQSTDHDDHEEEDGESKPEATELPSSSQKMSKKSMEKKLFSRRKAVAMERIAAAQERKSVAAERKATAMERIAISMETIANSFEQYIPE